MNRLNSQIKGSDKEDKGISKLRNNKIMILNITIWILVLVLLHGSIGGSWSGDAYPFFFGGYSTSYFDIEGVYNSDFWSIQDIQMREFDML